MEKKEERSELVGRFKVTSYPHLVCLLVGMFYLLINFGAHAEWSEGFHFGVVWSHVKDHLTLQFAH